MMSRFSGINRVSLRRRGNPYAYPNLLISFGCRASHAQESQLRMYNITTEYVGKSSVKSASINLLASFPSTMRLTALTSHKRNDGTVLMISGATDGALRRLRMSVPRMFAGDPSSIRMAEEDLIGGEVSTCGEPHSGAITSIAIHPGKNTLRIVYLPKYGPNERSADLI